MSKWIPSWRYVPIDYNQQVGVFENITQKCIFTNNLKGTALRVRLNNLYSSAPLTIRHGAVALRNRVTGKLSPRFPLTIGGNETLTAAPNTAPYTDPVECAVTHEDDFILWLYFEEAYEIRSVCTTSTWHSWQSTQQTGNFHETEALGFTIKPKLVPVLAMDPYPNQFAAGVCEVSVLAEDDARLIGLFGDSITHMSYFSDPLTAILYDRFPGKCAVINGGIAGNRIQKSYPPAPPGFPGEGHQFGIAGKDRFREDLCGGGTPDYVFIMEGVNDCSHSIVFREPEVPTPEDIFAALQDVVQQAKNLGSTVYVTTVTPFGAFGDPWRDQAEALRCAYNELIRGGVGDGIVDLDAVLRDPDDPHRMQDGMNLGDGVHPNWAGGTKMARAVADRFFTSL